jgi:hypothetical protein
MKRSERMQVRKRLAVGSIIGFGWLTCLAATATGSPMTCIVPNTVALDILPTGCDATLTNGPLTFTGVTATGGDVHNIEIDSLELFNLNGSGSSVEVFLQGVDTDVTSGGSTNFATVSQTDMYQIGPTGNTSYSADTGTQNFQVLHLIVADLKLNFGESGRPSEVSTASSSANDTANPGDFTVSSFFDIFTEIRLNPNLGNAGYVTADDDFLANSNTNGAGAQLQLQNFDPSSNPTLEGLLAPEPGSGTLIAAGLAGFALIRRRAKA